jgi:hypothetical protein
MFSLKKLEEKERENHKNGQAGKYKTARVYVT